MLVVSSLETVFCSVTLTVRPREIKKLRKAAASCALTLVADAELIFRFCSTRTNCSVHAVMPSPENPV